MRITDVNGTVIPLGRQGENLVNRVRFRIKSFRDEYGPGTFVLMVKRPNDLQFYPVRIQADNEYVYWDITSMDVAVAGRGKCELQYLINRSVIKTATFQTQILASAYSISQAPPLGMPAGYPGQVPPCQPYQPWVDEVVSSGRYAIEAVQASTDLVEEAKEVREDSLEAAHSAQNSREAAEHFQTRAEKAAEAAQQAANSMSFVKFDINEDGEVVVQQAERLGNTSFTLSKEGFLEVNF